MDKKNKGKKFLRKFLHNFIMSILPYIPLLLMWFFWTEPAEEFRTLSNTARGYLALTIALYGFAIGWSTWLLRNELNEIDKADELKKLEK